MFDKPPRLRKILKRIVGAALLAAASLPPIHAASLPAPTLPTRSEPWPEMAAYARAEGISIEGTDSYRPGADAKVGDSISILVTLSKGPEEQQWLVELRRSIATEKEHADHPPKAIRLKSAISSRLLEFGSGAKVAMDLRCIGPFSKKHPGKPVDKRGRVFLAPDLLAVGLDGSCKTALRQAAEQQAAVKESRGLGKPPPSSFTDAEEREAYGALLALQEFLQGILSSREVVDILWNVADKPSGLSAVMRGGAVVGRIDNDGDPLTLDGAVWGHPNISMFGLPIAVRLNGKPALRCMLVVGPTDSPFSTSAGIHAISAEPASNTAKRLEMRVISARRHTAGIGQGSP